MFREEIIRSSLGHLMSLGNLRVNSLIQFFTLIANMFAISIEDTGNHPSNLISEIKKCLISCLKSDPESIEELRQKLASKLSQPSVMGVLYRFIWIEKVMRLLSEYCVNVHTHVKPKAMTFIYEAVTCVHSNCQNIPATCKQLLHNHRL